MIDLKNAKRLFDEYVANYDKDNPKVALKIEHTLSCYGGLEKMLQ